MRRFIRSNETLRRSRKFVVSSGKFFFCRDSFLAASVSASPLVTCSKDSIGGGGPIEPDTVFVLSLSSTSAPEPGRLFRTPSSMLSKPDDRLVDVEPLPLVR